MQTFLPVSNYIECARILDNKRLPKQIMEARQILRVLLGTESKWRNHPAVRMWQGYTFSLTCYMDAMADEWCARGHAEHGAYTNCLKAGEYKKATSREAGSLAPPLWLGQECLHASHRANLLRKGCADATFLHAKAAGQNDDKNFPKLKRKWKQPHYERYWAEIFKPDVHYYTQFGWKETPTWGYWWPTKELV